MNSPGPWKWTTRDCLEAADGTDVLVADMHATEADRPLIAAAPELLGAVKALLAMVDTHDNGPAEPVVLLSRALVHRIEGTP